MSSITSRGGRSPRSSRSSSSPACCWRPSRPRSRSSATCGSDVPAYPGRVRSRRVLTITAATGAILLAYGLGAATVLLTSSGGKSPGRSSVLDQAERRISTQAVEPVSTAELERAAVEGMLRALDDRWSAYYAAGDFARFQQVLSGSYTGVGVWVHRATDGKLRVMSVQPHSPASRAGIHAGDVLVRVAGRPV